MAVQKLIQIIYISRSTFIPAAPFKGIEPNVARILSKSRINNRLNGLVGVLYFGDGCFFQCLEGEESAIDSLYAKLQTDTRHKDLRLLSRKPIVQRSFPDWAMKYVPLDGQMNRLLQSYGMETFNPYSFSDEITAKVMLLLQAAADPTAHANPNVYRPESNKALRQNSNRLVNIALGLSALSLILSTSALFLTLK